MRRLFGAGCSSVLAVAIGVAGCGGAIDSSGDEQPASATATSSRNSHRDELRNNFRFDNAYGSAATFSTEGRIDLTGPFFQSLGSNGRSCASCHQPGDGWTITPSHLVERFQKTGGTDPVFRLVDGSNSPRADVSTVAARLKAYSMLLTKGVIRVGIAVPSTAEFTLDAVDDPYGFASAAELSLFRRPLPSTNLKFLSTVMWDGRETFDGTDHCNHIDEGGKCFASIHDDLLQQGNDATQGHAEAVNPLDPATREAIVAFESTLFTAQVFDNHAHDLSAHKARGGPEFLAKLDTYYGINDNLGDYKTHAPFSSIIFTEYQAWEKLRSNRGKQFGHHDDDDSDEEQSVKNARVSIARGEKIFNERPITISGVGGLNFDAPFNPPLPASFVGTCGTCHDTPSMGNHSIVAPLDIGLADASRRTPDMPLYTLRNKTTNQTVQTTDPGRALISGKWADIGKFKGPTLRALAARAPYFHNGSASDLDAVVAFYDERFAMALTHAERKDLAAFLASL